MKRGNQRGKYRKKNTDGDFTMDGGLTIIELFLNNDVAGQKT